MDEITKSRIRIVLTKLISELWDTNIPGLPSKAGHTPQIVAEAALQVLVAIADARRN